MLGFFRRKIDAIADAPPGRKRDSAPLLETYRQSLFDCSHEAVMRRLEDAFDLFEKETISLDTFEKIVLAEKEAIQLDELTYDLDEPVDIGDAADDERTASIEAVEQCLAWIEGYRREG
jgi:hypothetical protein